MSEAVEADSRRVHRAAIEARAFTDADMTARVSSAHPGSREQPFDITGDECAVQWTTGPRREHEVRLEPVRTCGQSALSLPGFVIFQCPNYHGGERDRAS